MNIYLSFFNYFNYFPLIFFNLSILTIYTYFIILSLFSKEKIALYKLSNFYIRIIIILTIFLYLINLKMGLYENNNNISILNFKIGTNFLIILFLFLCFILYYIIDVIYKKEKTEWEFSFLLWFFLLGGLFLIHSSHLFLLVLSLEMISHSILAIIVLTRKKQNVEASLKMFIINAILSIPLLLSIAYINIYIPENIFMYNSFLFDNIFILLNDFKINNNDLIKKQILLILLIITFISKLGIFPFINWWINIYKGINSKILAPMLFLNKYSIIITLLKIKLAYGFLFTNLWWEIFFFFGIITGFIAIFWFLGQNIYIKHKILSIYLINIGISSLFLSVFEQNIIYYISFLFYLLIETFLFFTLLNILNLFKLNKFNLTSNKVKNKKVFYNISLYEDLKKLYTIKKEIIIFFLFISLNVISFPGTPLFFIKFYLLNYSIYTYFLSYNYLEYFNIIELFQINIYPGSYIFTLLIISFFSVILYFFFAQNLKKYTFESTLIYFDVINVSIINYKFYRIFSINILFFLFIYLILFYSHILCLNINQTLLITII